MGWQTRRDIAIETMRQGGQTDRQRMSDLTASNIAAMQQRGETSRSTARDINAMGMNTADNANRIATNKYTSDQSLAGSKYTSDQNLAGDKYKADIVAPVYEAQAQGLRQETQQANNIDILKHQIASKQSNPQDKLSTFTDKQPTRDYKVDQRNKMISEMIKGGQIGYPEAARTYDIDQAKLSEDPNEIIKAHKNHMAPGEAEAYDKMDDATKSLFIQMDPEQRKLFTSTVK